MMQRQRGTTLVEVLAASAIIAVGLAGSMSGLCFAYNLVLSLRYQSAMSLVAQAELERAKVWGYANLPYGTYNAASKVGTWGGAFDQSLNGGLGGWAPTTSTAYDIDGNQVALSNPAAAFTVSTTILDAGPNQVLPTPSGTSYTLDYYATRTLTVTVNGIAPVAGSVSIGTVLVRGGI